MWKFIMCCVSIYGFLAPSSAYGGIVVKQYDNNGYEINYEDPYETTTLPFIDDSDEKFLFELYEKSYKDHYEISNHPFISVIKNECFKKIGNAQAFMQMMTERCEPIPAIIESETSTIADKLCHDIPQWHVYLPLLLDLYRNCSSVDLFTWADKPPKVIIAFFIMALCNDRELLLTAFQDIEFGKCIDEYHSITQQCGDKLTIGSGMENHCRARESLLSCIAENLETCKTFGTNRLLEIFHPESACSEETGKTRSTELIKKDFNEIFKHPFVNVIKNECLRTTGSHQAFKQLLQDNPHELCFQLYESTMSTQEENSIVEIETIADKFCHNINEWSVCIPLYLDLYQNCSDADMFSWADKVPEVKIPMIYKLCDNRNILLTAFQEIEFGVCMSEYYIVNTQCYADVISPNADSDIIKGKVLCSEAFHDCIAEKLETTCKVVGINTLLKIFFPKEWCSQIIEGTNNFEH